MMYGIGFLDYFHIQFDYNFGLISFLVFFYLGWSYWWGIQLVWPRKLGILGCIIIGLPVGFFGGGIYKFIKYIRK